jgi:macrolide transport system ATP-binding/permease protein
MIRLRELRAWWLRLRGMRRGSRREQELAEEIECHVQMQAEENQRAGMAPGEARRAAILKLGGLEHTRQAYRERDTLPVLENFLQDLRFARRQLAGSPGFAVTAILILSLGIGASVALFAFVDAALLKPLPYQDPNRLTALYESAATYPQSNLSYPDYLDWKRLNHVFQSFDTWRFGEFLLRTGTSSEPVPAVRVTDSFFRTLGVAPILGRDFYAGEDLPSGPRTVILSYGAWQERFGARREIVGQAISLSGVPHTVVGVLPRTFHFAPRGPAEFWVPLHADGGCDVRRSCHALYGVGRLKDGVTVAAAQAEMQGIAQQLERQYPDSNRGQGALVMPLSEAIVGPIRPILLVLLSGAGMLLVIACVNVASLLLVRAESRRREMAVRGALGASPLRLMLQFVTEGLVLVCASTLLGLGAAFAVIRLLLRLIPAKMLATMPYLESAGTNGHALLCAAAIALAALLLFALTPLVRLPLRELQVGLSEAGRGAVSTFWRRFGANLVVLELAVAVVLLVGAGLLGKSLYRLLHVPVNFQPDHLATLSVAAPDTAYTTDPEKARLYKRVLDRVHALPGVESVALTSVLPVSFNGNTEWIRFAGRPYDGKHNDVLLRDVTPDYFRTIGAKLLSGRAFTNEEDGTKPLVAIINRSLARTYFPGQDPVGQRVGDTELSPKSMKEIVGVVDDFREGALDDQILPAIYYPMAQSTDSSFFLAARTAQDDAAMLPTLSAAVRGVDHELGVSDEVTMTMRMEASQTAYLHRSAAWLVGSFAALAALLGVVGLYGVIAYSVGQRTREIGVRMALGAQRATIYGLVLNQACRLTALGLAAGLLCSVATLSVMGRLLFEVKAWDLQTLLGVSVVLGVAALAASYVPAHRAASVNPVEALRAE